MVALYHEILYRPILNLLVFFYDVLASDIGLAIIAVTLVVRLVLYPSFQSSLKSQKALQELQPKIEEARAKHKDNKQGQMEAVMALYKEHKVNPLSSCLPLLIQLPVILALFQVLNNQLPKESIEGLYSFISNPGRLNSISLGLVNLAVGNVWLSALAAGVQFCQTKMLQPKRGQAGPKLEPMANIMQKQMLYFLPLVTFFVAVRLPAGLPLYWSVTTLFAIVQQFIIMKK